MNTIDSTLQLTEVLDATMRALKRKLLALTAFCTVFKRVKLMGDDTMALPYYPLATSASQSRATNGSYKALVTDTTTGTKKIVPTKNKVQALSFTATERARQPFFDPVMHGTLKGEQLAFDTLKDIFSVFRSSDYNSSSIAPVTSSNFDETEVGDMRVKASTDFWPEGMRRLLLNPLYGGNLLKQPQIIAAYARGDGGAAFRDGIIGNVLGFDIIESAGVYANNGVAFNVTATASTDLINAVAHGLNLGDAVIFPTLTGGAGLTAATVRYYVVAPTADTFQVSATPGGAAVDITSNATAGTVQKNESIAGMAVLPSAALVGFAPVPPTEGIAKFLVDYQEIVDADTGLVLEYKHLAYPDTDEEVQAVEVHYGYAIGDTAQAKLITTPLS